MHLAQLGMTVNCESADTLAQAAQSSCECPIPANVQGKVGQGLEQPGPVEGVTVHARGLELDVP